MTDKTIADVLDKSIDRLSGGASEIAKAAKQVAPHAWEVAVRQQVIEGTVYFVLLGLAIVASVSLLIYAARNGGWENMSESDAKPSGLALIAGGFIGTISGIALLCGLSGNVGRIVNPEYAAAEALLEAVK